MKDHSTCSDEYLRRRSFLTAALPGLGLTAIAAPQPTHAAEPPVRPGRPTYDIREFKAVGDGTTLDTNAIQAAIDACTASGGGIVLVPSGDFLSGTIWLKDNVTLHLAEGATLLGSKNQADYPAIPAPIQDVERKHYAMWALVYAENIANVTIEGRGRIAGQGGAFWQPGYDRSKRPRLVYMRGCKNVRLLDVTLFESAYWVANFVLCSNLMVRGITIDSWVAGNNDGLDVDSCDDVLISDCRIITEDDCIALKSAFPVPCRNVVITNCILKSTCGAVKFGTASVGGFKNITVSNCAVYDTEEPALKVLTADGGPLEDVTFSNIAMHNVSAPLWVRLANRGHEFGLKDLPQPRPVGMVRNILFNNILATISKAEIARNRPSKPQITISASGMPGHPIEGIVIDNLHVTFPGVGTLAEAKRSVEDIPDATAVEAQGLGTVRLRGYPSHDNWGVLPCYGLYVRHARGVALRNIRFAVDGQDWRSFLLCHDVDDLEVTGLTAPVTGDEPLIRLYQTRNALISGCRPIGSLTAFVRLEGQENAEVGLIGNDFRRVKKVCEFIAGAEPNCVDLAGNLGGAAKS